MFQIESNEYWRDVLEKFSKHKGTIKDFCSKNNVNANRLYTQRKKLERKRKDTPIFQAVDLNLNETRLESAQIPDKITPTFVDIRIEIGNAKIFIDSTNQKALAIVVKGLINGC